MEALEVLKAVGGLGGSGLGLYVIILWLTGNLVSKREHLEARADRDAARADSAAKDPVIRELVRQNAELLAASRIGIEVARSIPPAVDRVAKEREQL